MGQDIIKRAENTKLNLSDWNVMKEQAAVMIKSGFLPYGIKTEAQAISLGLAGKELGIGFMESIRSIHVIQGKPTISPQLMLALARRTGLLVDFQVKEEATKARVMLKRKGQSEFWCEFGDKEAKEMGLINKDNYRKQKGTMFLWRAISKAMRFVFPDVLLGMYQPEELGADIEMSDSEDGRLEVAKINETVQPEDIQETREKIEEISIEKKKEEVILMLNKLNDGNLDAMEAHLKKLTTYKSKTTGETMWLTLDSLDSVAEKRPNWISGILSKLEKEQPLDQVKK